MNQKKYFKIKYGYDVSDQVSITEDELEKAVYAQFSGRPVHLDTKMIKGANIISIEPHFHRHTGWHDWYVPKDGEDWAQIKRDCPDYTGIIENYKERVRFLMKAERLSDIGKNVFILELEKESLPEQDRKNLARLAEMKKVINKSI